MTDHAARRMRERGIEMDILVDMIDNGTIKFKDETHFWAFKTYPGRSDNMLCAAAIEGEAIIVKTVMHHFSEA
ncbi:MAG: DUF4258 domain-containing protein [Betaproteobacteria bacterium]|nr:DUF4258 domain-containing protein [Betaproteobacteria bacterium]